MSDTGARLIADAIKAAAEVIASGLLIAAVVRVLFGGSK